MALSSKSVSGRHIKEVAREIVNYVSWFFKKQQKHKLNINITAVTYEGTRISEGLMSIILAQDKESLEKRELFFSTFKGKKRMKKT